MPHSKPQLGIRHDLIALLTSMLNSSRMEKSEVLAVTNAKVCTAKTYIPTVARFWFAAHQS